MFDPTWSPGMPGLDLSSRYLPPWTRRSLRRLVSPSKACGCMPPPPWHLANPEDKREHHHGTALSYKKHRHGHTL